MSAVTYSDPAALAFLHRHFVPYQVDTKDPTAAGRTLLRAHRLLWEPGFVHRDPLGAELRRAVGYLEPDAFVAEGEIALGKSALLHRRFEESLEWFGRVDREPAPAALPEALYWAGIAAYRIDPDLGVLRERWEALRRRFPDSPWWSRADVLDPAR